MFFREERMKKFLEMIENDSQLKWANMEDRGFIFTVPFQQIKSLELESLYVKKEEPKMRIGNYLKKERVLLNMKAKNKEEAIREILAVLKNAEGIVDIEKFLEDVLEREKLCTTGIGNEVAIPHARTEAVKEFVIVTLLDS